MPRATTARSIARFLNDILRVREIGDASRNGLQVPSRRSDAIDRVGFAVDACVPTFEQAKKRGVGLLIVHHGIYWRKQKDRGLAEKRAAFLTARNIALYASHLPLDLHPEYGNNAQLARLLGLSRTRKFGRYHGLMIGIAGMFAKQTALSDVSAILDEKLDGACRAFHFGRKRLRTIGIVSGGGGSSIHEAVRDGLDCFLTGELDLALYNTARDCRINLIAAGHYATETTGVRALMPVLRDTFGVECIFIPDAKEI